MADAINSFNIDNLVQIFNQDANESTRRIPVQSEHRDQWMASSIFFRQIADGVSKLPTISITPKLVSSKPDVTVREHPVDENAPREIKLYSAAQFRSHINRLYPFHLDFFSEKLSALDFSQHRMGLYVFYDVNLGHLINDVDKESKKKTDRGKNMKRMNGLLLNEHRMFNQCAKEYATKHLTRDYEAMKSTVNQFMKAWLQRKSNTLLKPNSSIGQFYTQKMLIPLNAYDSLTSISFANLSTVLRLGSIPLLTVPENLDRVTLKCSDNHDHVVTNRFNPNYRLTSLVDDPNILAIISQYPSIDVVVSKSSFHLLIELFTSASPMSLPMSIREFQFENMENPTSPIKKKIIFIDKPLRQRVYTKRELNRRFYQRSFRSLLQTTTGGKRETTDNPFHSISFTERTEYHLTEIKLPTVEPIPVKQTSDIHDTRKVMDDGNDEDDDDDDDDDEAGMVISTDGASEEQQKLFNKSKQKIIQSAPILQERAANQSEQQKERTSMGPEPIVSTVKLATPTQGNYEYSLWQLGTLQVLVRSSFHGYARHSSGDAKDHDEMITCHAKLEYQPQFGLEQITDEEYRSLWFQSYLRHGASVLLGRINVYNQQVFKVDKLPYGEIDQNLKECQIDMIKPITKIYGLLYGLQSLETNQYLLSRSLNEENIHLYQTVSSPSTSTENVFDLQHEPWESNDLLVRSDLDAVPWIPLTPALLLPYHLDFERVPLTFCPRNKRCYDIDITIPAHRKRRNPVEQEEKSNQEKKKRKKRKKKNVQLRKKANNENKK